ncbi:T9SS type A sorting domain-containing protein [Mariniflexile sp.]|uniref:T9SS type A sorting domain-containing protein n=2 Tax=Mariniflexile sp. TaxID=1979402 RepID=UPI004047FFD3
MEKKYSYKITLLFITLFCAFNFGFGQSIFSNPITGTNPNTNNPYITGQTFNPNITVSGIGRGSGITGTNANDRYNAQNWNIPSFDNTDYFDFTLTPNAGYKIDFLNFQYTYRRSAGGPTNIAIRSSIDTFSNNIVSFTSGAPTTDIPASLDLSALAYQNITSTITFRIYGWGASAGTGTFSINDFTFNGFVSPLPPCLTSVTWNGTTWSGTPSLTTAATLLVDYDTANFGSFSVCRLTVNYGASLNIADYTFVEVENELTVDSGSTINVQPYGSFVQNNDGSINSISGDIFVDKITAPMDAWYEYTYWSSPVVGATIEVALDRSPTDRRFKYNGQNFLDRCAETSNNNILVCDDGFGNTLQDDIDDDNNDWQWIAGNTIMQPGIGYATTLTDFAYNTAPAEPNGKTFRFTFEGPFNNGKYEVPIYRNDFETNDYNWNFIGNPYPSAISADLFLAANSGIGRDVEGTAYDGTDYIDGAIFLWSQKSPPLSTANGNQALNFTNDDYAIINAVDQIAGGDGLKPTRYIPSGQGFFVSMSNGAISVSTTINADNQSIAQGTVLFNNSMRVLNNGTDNNNGQFFKNVNSKKKTAPVANKLWLNLTSDNGVFNQILVGYVNGATNGDDGIGYDTNKYPSKGAALYSTIEGSSKKFAIQGKAANSIHPDEIIKLGFKTTINVATLYTLSIDQLQGDFLTGNTVYLIDHLLNKVHDLSATNYTFTSAVGEFNDRFEIGFNAQALSTNDTLLITNSLKIVELQDDYVQFSTTNQLSIKAVYIYDLLGRQLYSFKGESKTEVYRLSHLKNSIYLAKVELSNGTIVTKKTVKK